MRDAASGRRLLAALVLAVAGALAVGAAGAAGAAEVATVEAYPERGVATVVRVTGDDGAPRPGVEVVARYRPNSQTTSREVVGTTGGDGEVSWTPADAGVVSLEARPPGSEEVVARRDVSVRFGGFPASGLLIMSLAALLLFGGAITGFSLLLRQPAHLPAEEPPST